MNETMETATGPGAECAHVTVFCPFNRSENNEKSYFHCTVKITKKSYFHCTVKITKKSYFHCTVKIMNAVILTVQ